MLQKWQRKNLLLCRNHIYFVILWVIVWCVVDSGMAGDSAHSWKRTNPGGGGAFSTIGAGPSGIVLAGSDLSGAYRSLDGGKSWDVIGTNRGIMETHISGIGFDPFDEKVLFLGTESGIYRSEDGGETFVKRYGTGYITDIEVARSNPSVVYAAYRSKFNELNSRVLLSEDNGNTWSSFRTDFPSDLAILKVICHPLNENTLYALTGKSRFVCGPAQLFKSTNRAKNWIRLAPGVGSIMDVTIVESNPHILYLTTYSATCENRYGWTDMAGKLYRSTDHGQTWEFFADKTGIIFLDPDSAGVVRLLDPREINSWRKDAGTWTSLDSGRTFTHTGFIDNWDTGYNGIYDPVLSTHRTYGRSFNGLAQTLGADLSNPEVILWVNGQFSFRSEDDGSTFHNTFTHEVKPGWWQSTGFDNIDMVDLVINPVDPSIVYVGLFDMGFWRSFDHGASWQACNPPEYTGAWQGYGGNVASIAADPTRKDVVWTTISRYQKGQDPTYLLQSDSTGARSSWVLSNGGLPTEEVMGISVVRTSPENERILFVTAQGDVYRSRDDGYNWEKVLENNGLRFTAVDYHDGNLVYAGGGAGLWRSTDGGDTWQETGLPEMRGSTNFWRSGGEGVFDIHPDMHQTARVYVTAFGTNKGLWRSTDGGKTWERLWTDRFMRRVAVSPLNPNIIYTTSSSAFTHGGYDPESNGVIVSFVGGKTWDKVYEGMAWPFAICVELDNTGTVFVGSSGTGFQMAAVPLATESEMGSIDQETSYDLQHNYPNPFVPETNIHFSLPKSGHVSLEVVNLLGKKIRTLVSQQLAKGSYSFSWDGFDSLGKKVSSGVYFYTLKAGSFRATKKMIVLE